MFNNTWPGSMILRLLVIFLCLFCSIVGIGCATTGQKSVSVVVEDDGRIKVQGKDTTLTEIGQAVKKSGAKPGSVIEVRLPKDATAKFRQALISNLARSGYSRTFFIKERQSAAYIEEKQKPTQQKSGRSGTF